MTIELYDDELSSACYAVRLFAGILGVPWTTRLVDVYPGRGNESPAFRRLNPFGDIPVLVDGGLVLRDAPAILVYLARLHDPSGRWYPDTGAAAVAQLQMWLGIARELYASAGVARLHDGFFAAADAPACRVRAHALLRALDEHVWFSQDADGSWLCPGPDPTIADIACFPDIALAEEGGVELLAYPALRRWMDAVKRIPGFRTMPGIFPAAPT